MWEHRHHHDEGYCCGGWGRADGGWTYGHHRPGPRRGGFRLAVLQALSEKPMHGYVLAQELARTYERPVSASLVYPTLQELSDRKYLTVEEKDGRKVYSITQEGLAFLQQNREAVERLKEGTDHARRVGGFDFVRSLAAMRDMVFMNEEYVNEEKMKKVQEILAEARRKVASVVFDQAEQI